MTQWQKIKLTLCNDGQFLVILKGCSGDNVYYNTWRATTIII